MVNRVSVENTRSGRIARLGVVLAGVAILLASAAPAARGQLFLEFRFELQPPVPLAVGEDAGTQAMALADLNGDGHLDLVAINQDDDRVSVLLGDGTGAFTLVNTIDLDVVPTAIAVADVSSDSAEGGVLPDGHPDLIVASDDGFPILLLGDGQGGFSDLDAQDLSDIVDGGSLVGLAVADFDANGEPDLALLDDGNEVRFLCDTQGTFVPCPSGVVPTNGDGAVDIAVGDFDGDTHADVAVLNRDSHDVSLIYGDGHGSFSGDPMTFSARVDELNEPRALAVGHIDADGHDDVVIVNHEEFSDLGVLVLFGLQRNRVHGEGFTVPFFATDLALGDFDHDGALDAVISSNDTTGASGPTLLAGTGTGFDQLLFAPIGTARMRGGRAVLAADVGGDALPDIIQLNADGAAVQVAINVSDQPTPTPTATFTPTAVIPTATATRRPNPDDDGCSIGAGPSHPAFELLAMLGALLALRRGRRRH